MAGARIRDRVMNTVTTTDATVTTLATITLPTAAVVLVRLGVIAKTSTPAGAGWTMDGGFKNVSGTVSQIGATVTTISLQDVALSLASIAFDVTGATCRVRVTGIAATTIDWEVSGEVVVS